MAPKITLCADFAAVLTLNHQSGLVAVPLAKFDANRGRVIEFFKIGVFPKNGGFLAYFGPKMGVPKNHLGGLGPLF